MADAAASHAVQPGVVAGAALGMAVTAATIGVLAYQQQLGEFYHSWKPWLIVLAGWLPWLWRHGWLLWQSWRVARQVRVIEHHPNLLRQILSRFERRELLDQPVPDKERSDDRYELLNKLQAALRPLGYALRAKEPDLL